MKENDDKGKGWRTSSSWKKGSGRKKTMMKKIEKKTSLQVTFSKRPPGLFKKANELSLLTGADVAVIAFSPGGKLFMFGNPSAEVIMDRYINPGGLVPERQVSLERPKVVKEGTTSGNRQAFWWEAPESELERLELTELELYGGELEKFMNKVRFRLMMESGSDSGFDWGFNYESPFMEDSGAGCTLNVPILIPADTCSTAPMSSSPDCDSFCADQDFNRGLCFNENPLVYKDSVAGCGFNEPSPIPVSGTSWTPMVEEYPALPQDSDCGFCFDNEKSHFLEDSIVGSDIAADSGSNSNKACTSCTSTHSDSFILQDIEKMMEASPECNSFSLEGFDCSFLFDGDDERHFLEDSAVGCTFNEPISVPAETSSTALPHDSDRDFYFGEPTNETSREDRGD